MAETRNISPAASSHSNFKEAVCIDAGRIYDSCSEKQCSGWKSLMTGID